MRRTSISGLCIVVLCLVKNTVVTHGKNDSKNNTEDRHKKSNEQEKNGNLAGAIETVHAIHNAVPSYDSSLRLGWLHYQSGRHNEALRYYQEALRYSPNSIDASLGSMLQWMALRQWEPAHIQGRILLAHAPSSQWANRYMALVEYMLGRYDKAIGRYRVSLKYSPGDPLMELGLGLSLVMKNQIRAGRRHCAKASVALRDDPRVAQCLNVKPERWTTQSQFFTLAGFYTDAWDRDGFIGGTVIASASAPSGIGFEIDLSYGWSSLQYVKDNSYQYSPGAALFYRNNKLSGWLHYSAIIGKGDYPGQGHLLSAFGTWTFSSLHIGGEFDVGLYDGFQTVQVAPELEYRLAHGLSVKFSPMLQIRLGDVERDELARNQSLRISGELSLQTPIPHGSLALSTFLGQRWFTAENHGLMVWNVDEDIASGLRLNLNLLPDTALSPSFGARIDYINHQFGLPHKTYVLGLTAGVTAQF